MLYVDVLKLTSINKVQLFQLIIYEEEGGIWREF